MLEAFCKVWVRKSTTSEVCYDRCIEKWVEYSRDRYMCHAPVEPIEIARLTIKSVVTVTSVNRTNFWFIYQYEVIEKDLRHLVLSTFLQIQN